MDMTWRELQRAWEAAPDDQALLAALIAARRRAGQPVPASLLDRQVFPARTLELPFEALAHVVPRVGETVDVETPAASPVSLPEHRLVEVWFTPTDETLPRAVRHLAGESVAPSIWCEDLTPSGLDALALLPDLRQLRLRGLHGTTDRGLQFLERTCQLERLTLDDAALLTANGLAHVGGLRNLVSFELTEAVHVDDAAFEWLPELESLSRVVLKPGFEATTTITDVTLLRLARAGHLEELVLRSWPGVSDDGVRALAGLTRLRTLTLESMRQVGEGAFEPLVGALDQLESLDLSGTHTGDAVLAKIAALPRLRSLDVGFCDGVTDDGIRALASTRLKTLSLGSRHLRGEGLATLPTCIEDLTIIGSVFRQGPPEESLLTLGRLARLRRFSSRSVRLTDAVVRELCRSPNLREVRLHEAPPLTHAAVEALAACEHLESLTVAICPGLIGAPFDLLARSGKLRRLYFDGIPADDATLARLAAIESLHHLDMNLSDWAELGVPLMGFTEDGLRELGRLTQLRSLSLSGPFGDSCAGLVATLRQVVPPTCQVDVIDL